MKKSNLGLVHSIKIMLFGLTMAVMCMIGLLWFLRPETSEVEKRKLTEFPKPTAASLWDGSYFSQVDTWYADTYPTRESLIAANQSMKNYYGIRSSQIVSNRTEAADEIPEAGDISNLPVQEEESSATPQPESSESHEESSSVPQESSESSESSEESESESSEESLPDGTIHDTGEMQNDIYITDNAGYSLYFFNREKAETYAGVINTLYGKWKDQLNIYEILIPVSAGVMIDPAILEDLGCSDEQKAIDYVYSLQDEGIHKVSVFENLKRHNAEYIYFHTDHHWTQLGAYYAYEMFCKEKGITPNPLDSFETMVFEDFLGTFYASSDQSQALSDNPDTIYAYVPKGTNRMTMITREDEELSWPIINDVSGYGSGSKYSAFVGGDNKYSYAHNESITDGSSVCIIKDSFGNAFIPWLVDHYEHIYWLDFRYADNTLSQMVADHGIQDVVFAINIDNVATSALSERIAEIGK